MKLAKSPVDSKHIAFIQNSLYENGVKKFQGPDRSMRTLVSTEVSLHGISEKCQWKNLSSPDWSVNENNKHKLLVSEFFIENYPFF